MNDKKIKDVFNEMRRIRIDILNQMRELGFDNVENHYLTTRLEFRDTTTSSWINAELGYEHDTNAGLFIHIIGISYHIDDDVWLFSWGSSYNIHNWWTKDLSYKLLEYITTKYPTIAEQSGLFVAWHQLEENYENTKSNWR